MQSNICIYITCIKGEKSYFYHHTTSKRVRLYSLSWSLCKSRQTNKNALLEGVFLIVSERLRWNVNVQLKKGGKEMKREKEKICLRLRLFFSSPPFLLSPWNGHCRCYILVPHIDGGLIHFKIFKILVWTQTLRFLSSDNLRKSLS